MEDKEKKVVETGKVKPTIVKIPDLVDAAALGKIPPAKAASIIRKAFVALNEQISATESGVIRVVGLGNFRIRSVEKEKEGQKTTVKKVAFVARTPKKTLAVEE